MNRRPSLIAIAVALLSVFATGAAAESVAFVGATIHPVSEPPIEGGVLLVEGSTIVAVGADVEVPADARVVDLAGSHLYPAFVHPGSVLGLTEIGSVRGTVDTTEMGDNNAHIRTEVAVNPDSELFPPTIAGGVVYAHVVPQGGTFAGTSAVMRLDGWSWEEMTVAAPVGMHVNYPAMVRPTRGWGVPDEEEFERRKERALETLRETLADARAYAKARRAAAAGGAPRVDANPRLEALVPVLDGGLPIFLHAAEKTQIESALDWAAEEGLTNIVLVTGPDAQYLAERLAAEDVSVLLDGVHTLPSRRWEPYDAAFTPAARLHAAGVRFAIGDGGGGFGASNARNLPSHAATAAAHGLPREAALRAVTLSAAELLGVDDRVGSLEPGKEASFFAATGDPLEILTRIERVWVAGQEYDLSRDRQRRLYERWRDRPARD